MSLIRWSALPLLGAITIACSSDSAFGPPGHFAHAAASFACGPADGPAVAIYLAPFPITTIAPQGSYVRVVIEGTVEDIRGAVQPLGPHANGGAAFYADGGEIENATAGYLMIQSGNSGESIAGTVDAEFPNAGHLHTTFNADWLSTGEVCV